MDDGQSDYVLWIYMVFFVFCFLHEVTLIFCLGTRTEFVCCRLGSYLSSHCRKKPNSGRCRREGLALQAVTNFFNSDTFWGSILLRYFHFRRPEFGGGAQSTQMNDHLDSTSLPAFAILQTSVRAPLLSPIC